MEDKKSVMLKRRGQFFEKSSFDFANLFGFEGIFLGYSIPFVCPLNIFSPFSSYKTGKLKVERERNTITVMKR